MIYVIKEIIIIFYWLFGIFISFTIANFIEIFFTLVENQETSKRILLVKIHNII